MSAASSTSGFNAEEPAAVIDPVRSAFFSAAVVAASFAVSAAAAVVVAAAAAVVVAAAVVDAVLLLLPHPVIMLTANTPAPASAITFLVFIILFSSSKVFVFVSLYSIIFITNPRNPKPCFGNYFV